MAPGQGYSFGSTQTLPCTVPCSAIAPATGTPAVLTPVNAGISNGGSLGTARNGTSSGVCSIAASDETFLGGKPASATVTLTGGTITAINENSLAGNVTSISGPYTTATGTYAEPVIGCGGLTGAILTLS